MARLNCAVLVAIVFVLASASAERREDPEVEKASVTLLNAAGDFIDVVRSVSISEVAVHGAHGETGRGQKKLMQLAIPLIIGFKLAGIIVAAMTALKVLVFKTVFMSGLAIVASLALAAKSLYDRMKNKSAQAPAGHATPYAYYPGLAAQADMSWDPSNAAGYEIHDLGAASGGLGGGLGAAADLSHFGTDFQASYATHTGFSGAGAGATQVAERKSHLVRAPVYRTKVYKTIVKETRK